MLGIVTSVTASAVVLFRPEPTKSGFWTVAPCPMEAMLTYPKPRFDLVSCRKTCRELAKLPTVQHTRAASYLERGPPRGRDANKFNGRNHGTRSRSRSSKAALSRK